MITSFVGNVAGENVDDDDGGDDDLAATDDDNDDDDDDEATFVLSNIVVGSVCGARLSG
jgi:hypothetical protein